MADALTELTLPAAFSGAQRALTSVPWPAGRADVPSIAGVEHQVVPLLASTERPRLRRFLLLAHAAGGLPDRLSVQGGPAGSGGDPAEGFSDVTITTLGEQLDASQYVYRECEARIRVAGREIGLRLGLLPKENALRDHAPANYSWWQWSRAERIWSGRLAEAWRIGGHLVPYTIDTPGRWTRPDLTQLGDLLNEFCGDVLHGEVYLIAWRDGLVQLTVHYKSAYFHTFPKAIEAFPVVRLEGLKTGSSGGARIDFSPCSLMFDAAAPVVREVDGATIIRPWSDLRLLANRTRDGQLIYLPPGEPDVLPAGVSRSFWFNIAPGHLDGRVARYRVPPAWYKACGEIETDAAGPAARLGERNAAAIRAETHLGGIDTGRVWRYLSRWKRIGRVEEDGAEWEGNLAQAMFTLAQQRGEDPAEHWQVYLHHAYHAADVSVYHGSWMGRLECTAAFTAPLPKFRFGGMLAAYLETGDEYLLEVSRSLAGVFMAMEWALEPRSAIGRDAYPLACLMALYDYSGDRLYLDFARRMSSRLLSTQQPDGGFSAQAGAGVLTGVSCRTGKKDIHFGSGILAPVALVEYAMRDDAARWPLALRPRLKKWMELMLACQKADGHWYVEGKSDEPYTLTGSATLLTLIRAGQILNDDRPRRAVARYLDTMNAENKFVLGTHAFLAPLYAHVADAVLHRPM